MMRIFTRGARAVAAAVGLLGVGLTVPAARAARVEGLYAASVPVADASAEATDAAFAEALKRVLVKVTGRPSAAADPALLSRFGDPGRLVQQYRRDGAASLWASFDPVAVRRGLADAGVPAWGEDRPATLVWLAYDSGAGERDVLASGGADTDTPGAATLRRDLQDAASSSGVPLVLPLRDSQELAAVTYADVWGEFSEPVAKASARYRPDAVLVGRARLFPPGLQDVRWTLLLGADRLEWRGGVADGPRGLAERLAQRLAAPASAGSGGVRLAVGGIGSLDQYGLVLGHLRGLDGVEAVDVGEVSGDTTLFELRVRGGRDQVERTLAARGLLQPVAAAGVPAGELHYRLTVNR
jgi:hypothetical protein